MAPLRGPGVGSGCFFSTRGENLSLGFPLPASQPHQSPRAPKKGRNLLWEKQGDLGFWGRAGAAGSANEAETYPKLSALCHPGKTSAIETRKGLVVPKQAARSWITQETAQETGQKGANPKNTLRTTNSSAVAAPALSQGHKMGRSNQ